MIKKVKKATVKKKCELILKSNAKYFDKSMLDACVVNSNRW